MKLHTILDRRLYQRGRTDHLASSVKAETLERKNITFVANFSSRRDEELASMVDYLHWPFPDSVVPDETLLILYASRIIRHIREDQGAVLVQCNAGRNRSGLMSALVVMVLQNLSGKQAIAWVRERRKNALANPAFVKFLEDFTSGSP